MTVQLWITAWIGLIAWSLTEYVMHRFVLHGIEPFRAWHAAHHAGIPPRPWRAQALPIAALMAIAAFVPAALFGHAWLGFAMGWAAGHGLYAATHHAVHHGRCRHPWLAQRKFHHALHHDACRPAGYYGVTSCFWDRLLGTHHLHEF